MSESKTAKSGDPRVDDLQRLIREQAAEEALALRRHMEERVADARARAEAQVGTIREVARRDGEEKGRREAAKRLAIAETESQQMWLRAREDLFETVLRSAQEQLAGFRAMPGAAEILRGLVEEAVCALPPGPLRVRAPEGYAELVTTEAITRIGGDRSPLQFTTEAAPDGGVIVETIDARLRFDNSFEARLRRQQHELRRLLERILIAEAD